MTRGKRGGKGGARKRSANPAPITPAPGSPVLAMAILAAGAVAMIAGASTYSWWRFSASEGLGLREIHVCASATCTPYDYNAAGVDHGTWVTLGLVACYGAFVVTAVGLVAVYARWQKLVVARNAARLALVLAVALLGVAIAFVLARPEELSLAEGEFQRARFYMRATSLGWSAIAYMVGAIAVAGSSLQLARR